MQCVCSICHRPVDCGDIMCPICECQQAKEVMASVRSIGELQQNISVAGQGGTPTN